MSLVNFSPESIAQLRAILGSFGDDEIAREIKSTVPYIESRYFQVSSIVEKETESGDKYNEYKAFEVLPDGTPVDDGIIFDSDATNTFKPADPIYFDNLRINELIFSGSVELGYAYQVEAVWRELENEDPVYYIIPKGGGGGASIFRLKCLSDVTIGYNGTSSAFSIIDDSDVVTEANVTVIQRKFTTANFYENEILYAQSDAVGYDLSPFLAGIGGTSA